MEGLLAVLRTGGVGLELDVIEVDAEVHAQAIWNCGSLYFRQLRGLHVYLNGEVLDDPRLVAGKLTWVRLARDA